MHIHVSQSVLKFFDRPLEILSCPDRFPVTWCSVFSRISLQQSLPTCLSLKLRAGCAVVVLSRSRSKFDALLPIIKEKKLPTSSDKLHFISMDLASVDDIKRAGVEANEWAGGCADILVNNGGSRFTHNYHISSSYSVLCISPYVFFASAFRASCRERLAYINPR